MRSWYCRRKAFHVGSGGTSSSLFAPYCATRLETSSEDSPVSRVTLNCANASSLDNRNHDVSTALLCYSYDFSSCWYLADRMFFVTVKLLHPEPKKAIEN